MSFSDILYTLLIGPLEAMFEIIYVLSVALIRSPGLSIVVLSLIMNLLLLPLYRRTDAIQEDAIRTEKAMKPYVTHIKKTFHGDERFMLLQTCYRQHHYKPTDSLKGLTPLLLEIPFFMAAYQFLSHLELLQGASFGPIRDLSAPDGLLHIGVLSVNLLPILMTLINLVSSWLYTKDAPVKTKVQLYGMAALFLVLLYDSPAALSFYWTLNNLFSLVKNALQKTKKPMLILACIASPLSLIGSVLALRMPLSPLKKTVAVCGMLAVLNVPLLLCLLKKVLPKKKRETVCTGKDRAGFFCACLVMTVLVGLLIPSALIHTSPEEFLVIGQDFNPNISYVLYTALLTAGMFLIWFGLFYLLATPRARKAMTLCMWLLCGISLTDYMFFGRNYGILSSDLIFETPISNSLTAIGLNLLALLAVCGLIWLLFRKKAQLLTVIGTAASVAMLAMSAVNTVQSQRIISAKLEQFAQNKAAETALFSLSKTDKNVVVLMLDRAAGPYVPYIFHENPEIRQQFEGFTYYPNTLSLGPNTNHALSEVFGGYEYIPYEMNQRAELSLEEKHDQALTVMPVLFLESGYRVTVCDPTYAGYNWIPDLSIYDPYPEISTHITMGRYDNFGLEFSAHLQGKILHYSLMKIAPICLHPHIYRDGHYMKFKSDFSQFRKNLLQASGRDRAFEQSYRVLEKLPQLTAVTDTPGSTFQMMCNETTHSPVLLQLPDYTYTNQVDNTAYADPVHTDGQGHILTIDEPLTVTHYHCNAAALQQVGHWLDYLRENGIYDNTRIILVGDHARELGFLPTFTTEDGWEEDLSYYAPLLMVKDFGSTEFRVDDALMTNADVPTIAMSDLISNPVNPHTGKIISSAYKDSHPLYVLTSHIWDIQKDNGNTFQKGHWLSFSGTDITDLNSWQYAGWGTLPETENP